MPQTDFEKQFGGYDDLTHVPASDIMSAGQFPDMPPESQGSRAVRLAGKGLTFGLGQRDIQAQGLGESAIEFAGSIPSTIGAIALAGPALGAIPRVGSALAKLGPVARAMTTAGAVGGTIGAGKALQEGDITEIPKEAAWWMGGEGVGQLGIKGLAKLRGIKALEHGEIPKPPAATAEAAAAAEANANVTRGSVVDQILDPTEPIGPPAPRTAPQGMIQAEGPRGPTSLLPPAEVPPNLPIDGPKVRFVKVGDDTPNFDDVPDLVLGKKGDFGFKRDAGPGTTTLYRAEVGEGTGATFTTDRAAAEDAARKVGGFLKSVDIPETELQTFAKGKGYEIPPAIQKQYGAGEEAVLDRDMSAKNLQKEASQSQKRLAKLQAKPPAEFDLVDEFGDPTGGPMGPLTPGQAAQRSFPTPRDPNAPAFRVLPQEPPPPPPVQKPSLSSMTESVHDNPGIHENQVKPLKEVVEPTTGTTMVVPKTPQAKYAFDANRNLIRNVEPPITAPMAENLKTPLNVAKLDHGMQVEQFKTSNLLKKSEEEIDKITSAVDGSGTIKPWKTVEMTQSPQSERIATNLDRQGIPQAEMQQFVDQAGAKWEARSGEAMSQRFMNEEDKAILGLTKKQYIQNEVLKELQRRGPC